jgi:hypothetical protein
MVIGLFPLYQANQAPTMPGVLPGDELAMSEPLVLRPVAPQPEIVARLCWAATGHEAPGGAASRTCSESPRAGCGISASSLWNGSPPCRSSELRASWASIPRHPEVISCGPWIICTSAPLETPYVGGDARPRRPPWGGRTLPRPGARARASRLHALATPNRRRLRGALGERGPWMGMLPAGMLCSDGSPRPEGGDYAAFDRDPRE